MADQTLVERITNGGDIRVGLLATTVIGAAITALLEGFTAFTLELGALFTLVPRGLAGFGTELLQVVFGLLALGARGAFLEAIPFVASAGPAGLLVAAGIVLAAGYGFAVVIDRA